MTEPRQKRHHSKQDYETPAELLEAVAARFGTIRLDLAARADNAKALWWLGPGSQIAEDALAPDVDWSRMCMLSVFGETPGFDVWRWRP